nr:MAG TPA: hypothetical protein [Caudoviricetes sp.]
MLTLLVNMLVCYHIYFNCQHKKIKKYCFFFI